MDSEDKLAELVLSKIRVLKLENRVILMCEKCGKIWDLNGSNSLVCPNGCNKPSKMQDV